MAVIEDLAREFKDEAFILPTVYSPLALAYQTLGRGKDLKKLAEENPAGLLSPATDLLNV